MEISYSSLIESQDRELIERSVLFRNWCSAVSQNYELRRVRIDSVDLIERKGQRIPLFIKLRAIAYSADGHRCDQVVVLRGNAVAVLVVLFCEEKSYLLLVDQPRLAIGQRHYLEIVAGILDWSSDSKSVAIEELHEEAGIEATVDELILLSDGLSTSCGLLDESVALYALERTVDQATLSLWQGREQTYTLENEGIKTKIIPYHEGASTFLDTKGITALYFYERWLKSQGRSIA